MWRFFPAEGNLIGVVWNALFIGVLVVVEVRREVQQERLFVADDLEAVPALPWDADYFLVVFADDERVYLALRRRVVAVIVDADLDSTLRTDKVVDLAARVAVPGTDDAGVTQRVVRHRRLGIVLLPVLAEHFDEVAPLVGIHLEVADFDTVDHILAIARPSA